MYVCVCAPPGDRRCNTYMKDISRHIERELKIVVDTFMSRKCCSS